MQLCKVTTSGLEAGRPSEFVLLSRQLEILQECLHSTNKNWLLFRTLLIGCHTDAIFDVRVQLPRIPIGPPKSHLVSRTRIWPWPPKGIHCGVSSYQTAPLAQPGDGFGMLLVSHPDCVHSEDGCRLPTRHLPIAGVWFVAAPTHGKSAQMCSSFWETFH